MSHFFIQTTKDTDLPLWQEIAGGPVHSWGPTQATSELAYEAVWNERRHYIRLFNIGCKSVQRNAARVLKTLGIKVLHAPVHCLPCPSGALHMAGLNL